MPRLYICHCPIKCGDRRPILEDHLKKRGFTDIRWITDYSVDHPFVIWLHKRLGETTRLSHISGLVKNLEMFLDVVRDTSSETQFWQCNDDVVFIKDWDQYHVPKNLEYVNLSVGVNFYIIPNGKLRTIGNNGGAEVFSFTKKFARLVLDNVDTRQTIDIIIHGLLHHMGHPVVCMPIAHQTSLLEPKNSTILFDETLEPWIPFVENFKPTGIKYENLRNESDLFTRDDA
jgi:hypothetical protein